MDAMGHGAVPEASVKCQRVEHAKAKKAHCNTTQITAVLIRPASSCILFESSYLECQDCNNAQVLIFYLLLFIIRSPDRRTQPVLGSCQVNTLRETLADIRQQLERKKLRLQNVARYGQATWIQIDQLLKRFPHSSFRNFTKQLKPLQFVWYVFSFLVLTPLATKRCLQIRRSWQKRKHWEENWMLDMIWLQTEILMG